MSEEADSFFKAWASFEYMRAQAVELLKQLELSELNLRFNLKKQEDLCHRLSQIASLIAKMEKLVGPMPAKSASVV